MATSIVKARMRRGAKGLLLGVLPLGVGCFPVAAETLDGECRVESAIDCTVTGYDEGVALDVGLVGYGCSEGRRPDDEATFREGVPEGRLCANRGPLADGREAYCCTEATTTCALDPVSDCEDATTGYQCFGSNRPESLNPALKCSNGHHERGLIGYCCTGTPEASPCLQSDAAGCAVSMMGFLCKGDRLPRGEDLGPNKSRADYFHPACSIPAVAPNPEYQTYCCFMPAPVPEGGTCVSHSRVPGCEPGRFGFACYGPDRPEENNYPMTCEAGHPGLSAEGYDATLYCCDFDE